jgi:hypothetical protein
MLLAKAKLDKNDLAQMNKDYFQSLEKERLVEVASNLHQLATQLWEKQQRNSANSSQPPSKNHPYTSKVTTETDSDSPASEGKSASDQSESQETEEEIRNNSQKTQSKKPGKQAGAKGFGRRQVLKAEIIIPHYPHECAACNQALTQSQSSVLPGTLCAGIRIRTSRISGGLSASSLLSNHLWLRSWHLCPARNRLCIRGRRAYQRFKVD